MADTLDAARFVGRSVKEMEEAFAMEPDAAAQFLGESREVMAAIIPAPAPQKAPDATTTAPAAAPPAAKRTRKAAK